MAKDQTKRLKPSILQADKDAFDALKGMPGYTPADSDYTVVKVEAIKTAMGLKQADEVQKEGIAAGARDTANAAEWEFHNAMLGVKTQVIAQYGEDSDELQALGLKKKSERKKPHKKTPPPPPGP